jgi:hypothetical protein
MTSVVTETFFRPEEVARERLSIPAALYNRCRLMLSRCRYGHVFVPVRSMQMQSVIDDEEIIFVDNQAYAVRNGNGGRLIMLAWSFRHDQSRDDLNEPAPIELVYYHSSARDLHNRLIGEFAKALDLLEQRHRDHGCEPRAKKILPFRSEV